MSINTPINLNKHTWDIVVLKKGIYVAFSRAVVVGKYCCNTFQYNHSKSLQSADTERSFFRWENGSDCQRKTHLCVINMSVWETNALISENIKSHEAGFS